MMVPVAVLQARNWSDSGKKMREAGGKMHVA
jgi:hypothetical protein